MIEAIANSLPMAVGVALSPIPIAAVLVMLLSRRAAVAAPAFLVGWVLGILAVGTLVLAAPGIESERGEPTTLSGILRVALGALMFLLATRQWRNRPAADEAPEAPPLLARLDELSFPRACLTGLLLSGVNPKNLVLTAAGAAAIDVALTETAPMLTSLLVFTAIASLTVALPVLSYFLARERAEALFATWKEWLIRNNAAILLALFVLLGTLLIGRGLRVLAG